MHAVVAANAEIDQPWVADAAVQLAQQTGASIAVVSVDELEEGAQAALPRSAFTRRAEEAATAMVDRLAQAGVQATKTVLSGRALDRILEFVENEGADLVVVGSSTRGPLASRFLGNVPLGLMERSPKPVLVVTHPQSS